MPGRGTARLVRHIVTLPDGHRIGVSIAGHGIPLVLLHGFGANGSLYHRSLGHLAHLGFRVIAIDTPGHGDTDAPRTPDLPYAAELVSRTLEHLGIRTAVLVGHSMGGRIVTEVAVRRPDQVLAVVLLDAIVGRPWDHAQRWLLAPPMLAKFALDFVIDVVDAVPHHARGALALGADARRALHRHLTHPWDVAAVATAILRSGPSHELLDHLGALGIPVVAIHGEHDRVVPLAAAVDAIRRTRGELVVVQAATHCWMLRCAETLSAIVEELLSGRLGRVCAATPVAACYQPDARISSLVVTTARPTAPTRRRAPLYEWTHDTVADAAS